MKMRNVMRGILSALGMGILILDSRTALAGAAEGVDLCLRTIIPSLFPFFILSGILVNSLMGIELPFLKPVGRLLGMPTGTEMLLVSGYLGGYPVGAKCVRDAWAEGKLSTEDAQRMLSFCSNAGPAFIFGMAAPFFSAPGAGWILWAIHILSSILAGTVLRRRSAATAIPSVGTETSITQAMSNAIKACAQVCGWVIAFRILCGFMQRWFLWLLSDMAVSAVIGSLELANGCMSLGKIISEPARYILCSSILAFGGLCVFMQTMAVTQGLILRYYLYGKALQTVFSILLTMMYLKMLSPLWLFLFPFWFLARKTRKRTSNPRAVAV